ncbi:MAG: hypothetical protein KTR31_14330 [Myxococcales bacterium]|nr:hypothetical protein [Myxococcales bacterium]
MSRLAPLSWLLLPLLVGCQQYENIDEACKENVGGDKGASAEAVEVFQRITCYRRYAGLAKGKMNRRVTEAVENHARYLSIHGLDFGTFWQLEEQGEGFTGADAFERLDHTGYLVEEVGASAFVWEVLLTQIEADTDQTELVDQYMRDPFLRDVWLAPGWDAGSYAQAPVEGKFGPFLVYMNIVLYFPSGSRSTRPVTYPVDGQTGVPTSWFVPYPDKVFAGLDTEVGFPITLTAGSSILGTGSTNVLDVVVDQSTITHEGTGERVAHRVIPPGQYWPGTNWSTAILLPEQPLEPDTTYTVEVQMGWVGNDNHRETVSFTTESEPAGAAASSRVVGTRLTPMRSRP